MQFKVYPFLLYKIHFFTLCFIVFEAMESSTSTLINSCDEQKWEADEEEEEALSLCDLPMNLIKEEDQRVHNEENGEPQTSKSEEDFNFGSWSDSVSIKPEMCTPDEVFFKGQILPLRHSVSSDTSRCLSRSESMDHGSLSRFTSVSSSSTRSTSHYTTSSSSSNSMAPPKATKIRNNFDMHPSPKPQIRLSKTRTPNVSSRNQRSSSMWDFFRLGLVRAPELELQDLKLRSNNNKNNDNKNSVSRNSSCNSSNSNSSSSTKVVNNHQQDSNKGLLEKRMGGLFSGCKCSVNAVETVPSNNIVVAKSNNNSNKNIVEKVKATTTTTSHARSAIKEKNKKKQALLRHRTFEWIKELSHATYVDGA